MSRVAQTGLALAICLLVFVKLLYDLYIGADGGLTPNLANDAINWAWPYYNYASTSVRSGVMPLWNPYTVLGSPLLADLSFGMLYPINWIIFLVDVPDALLVILLLTVVIGMAGMYGYTRYLDLALPARIFCVALFAYALFTEAFHPALGSSFCWFPVLLWFTHRFIDAPGCLNALSISIVLAACFLAGFPNFFFYTCLMLFVYGFVLLVFSWPRHGFAGTVSLVAMLVPALMLMLGLVAAQLIPAYELSSLSVRAVESGNAYQSESVLENFSLELMIRNYFLTNSAYLYANSVIQIQSGIYYLGSALLLLPFSFASRKYRIVSVALGTAFIFMALFLLSNQVPALSFLQKIPLADSLRIHGRGMAYAQFLLIVLAGVGLSALCERVKQTPEAVARPRALLETALFVTYAVLLEAYALQILDNKWYFASFVICTLLIVLVLLRHIGSPRTIRYCWVLALIIIIDVSTHRSNRFLVPAFATNEGRFVSSNLSEAKSGVGHFRVLFVPGSEGRAYQLANVGPKYQVPNISAYSSFGLARWENFIRYLAGAEEFDLVMSKSMNERFYGALIPSLLRLLSKEPRILELASLRYWYSRDGNAESENALPRAYAVRHYFQAKDEDESLAAIKANLGLLEKSVVLESASPSFPPASAPVAGDSGDVDITLYSAHRVELDVDVAEPSIVVLTDAFYPGWEAYVDSEITPVFRANSLFRAVEVPAGKHQVSFRFHSGSLYWGMVITLISIGLVIAVVLREGTRQRRVRDTSTV